jgi:hypothetical protein
MKQLLLFLTVMIFLGSQLYAQKTTVVVPGYYEAGTYGTLNDAIDQAVSDGTINNTIFKLNSYDVYVLSKSIYIDKGQSLDIEADKPGTDQNSAPPQIVWTEETITRDYVIQTYGDIVMKNIWVRYADILGAKVSSSITFENQDAADDPERGDFDGVIFDYDGIGSEAGGAVNVKADHFIGKFENCYWRNNSDNHFQYYGRAISFPYQSSGWHGDTVLFENCTFDNISRIVMQEGHEFFDNILLNHCTILNTVEWVLQGLDGNYHNVAVTNSIIVNPYMLGYRALDVCDSTQTYDDFTAGLCGKPGGGLIQDMTPVDSLPFEVNYTDKDRKIFIGNDAYMYTDYMQAWYTDCGWCKDQHKARLDEELHHPYPMVGQANINIFDSTDGEGNRVFPTLNIDSSTIYSDDPQFIVPATNQDTMLMFIEFKWSTAADIDWSFDPYAGYAQKWPLPENLAYNNTAYKTAAMGGFPLGDLNWYPDQMPAWQAQRDAEWKTIDDKLNGVSVGVKDLQRGAPADYVLKQNYPNPFNPTTIIEYSVPKSGYVSLKVYNLLGQEVATLFSGNQKAGSYLATFDGKDLASGIYMYRLQSDNVSITKKFVLMK